MAMAKLTFEEFLEKAPLIYEKLNSIENILLTMGPQDGPKEDELLTMDQTSQLTNLRVSTLYGLVSRRAIPVYKRGKRLYFSKFELTDWLKEGRKQTAAEVVADAEQFLENRKRDGGSPI